MKKYSLIVGSMLACLFISFSAFAQSDRNEAIIRSSLHGLEYQLKAGFNIGGITPIPIPAEIRSIDSYNPTVALSIGGEVTKWFGPEKNWGVVVGLNLDNKSMQTKATVKNYGMEIIGSSGERVSGVWTGGVKTKADNTYLALPVMAAYKIDNRWSVKAGPYVSYLLQGEFSGHVYDGYLRDGSPVGPKVEFKDGKIAAYDFSDEIRKFQWGAQLGAQWKAFNHLNVYADLTWGFNDIFKDDFNTVTFAMYPIYLNLGFGYTF